MQTLKITRPDDMHLHLRDGARMQSVVLDSVRQFARAIVMPNLKPALVKVDQVLAYRERIMAALPGTASFEPMMTLYLTDRTSTTDIEEAADSGLIKAAKYYPAGATTNSENGVTAMQHIFPILESMSEQGLLLLLHGEVTDPNVDIFDREQVFIDQVLLDLLERFPKLKIVLEHITTSQAADLVLHGPENLAATVTPQHCLLNRNALLAGGLHAHNYCLPILKAEQHRQSILAAATSGHPRIFLGTDSAPHARNEKESDCGCAGIYSAHNALELYTEIFEQAGCLNKLEAFASFNGADFYGIKRNQGTVELGKQDWVVPDQLPFGDQSVVPFRYGEVCHWKLKQSQ